MGEVYLILCANLAGIFLPGSEKQRNIDLRQDKDSDIIFRKFRLLNQLQIELSTCWVRFSDALQNRISVATFNLLQSQPLLEADHITALNYLSLIDPNALWFNSWMTPFQSRSKALTFIARLNHEKRLAVNYLIFLFEFTSPKSARLVHLAEYS